MARNEKIFSKNFSKYSITTMSANILVYGDTVSNPILRCGENYTIHNTPQTLYVQERSIAPSPNVVSGNFNVGKTNISISGCNFSGNSCVIRNYSNQRVDFDGNDNSLELIVPKQSISPEIEIISENGEVNIRDLFLLRLIAQTTSGNINLSAFNSYLTHLISTSGNINAEIYESILNYITNIQTNYGIAKQKSTETVVPTFLKEKNVLNASSVYGNIEVIFKGKKL